MAKPAVVDDPNAVKPDDEPGDKPSDVTVDLDNPPTPAADADTPEAKTAAELKTQFEEAQAEHERQLTALTNQLNGARRINQKYERRIQRLETGHRPAPQVTPTEPGDGQITLDERAQELVDVGKWQEAVDLRSKALAKAAIEAYKEERASEDRKARDQATVRSLQEKAYTRYPELHPTTGDEEAPICQLLNEVADAHPEYTRMTFGLRLALADAEDLARERGISLNGSNPRTASEPGSSQETVRRRRADQGALGQGRSPGGKNTVVLSRDQKAFCDHNNIRYEDYGKYLKSVEQGGGIEL